MSKAELRAYVLVHRDNNEAFYQLVDRLKANSKNNIRYPCPKTPEDVAKMEEVIREGIKKLEEY
ncbi:MAG: hypothetical protein AB4426_15645 [Xenococcaceae cyanobacterium]